MCVLAKFLLGTMNTARWVGEHYQEVGASQEDVKEERPPQI